MMFNMIFGHRYWVAFSFFDNMDMLIDAEIGEENPWGDKPMLPGVELDPVFVIVAGSKYLGHVKVYTEQAPAEYWARSIKDATTVWACWHMGYPVGPFGTEEQYRHAKRGAIHVTVVQLKAADPRLAAEKALMTYKASSS